MGNSFSKRVIMFFFRNLSERAMRSEDADPVYGHLLWQLWRNIRLVWIRIIFFIAGIQC